MTDGAIHQMSAAVGALQAEIRILKETVDHREALASDGRRSVHDKLDNLRTNVTIVSADVENLSRDFLEIGPAITEFKNQRQRQIWARELGGYLWSAMLVAAGFLGWGIHEAIIWIRHGG